MFGSNGPCPSLSPSEYLPPFSILEPAYYSCDFPQLDGCQQQQIDSSETECHSSAPPTPDVISGIISLTGPGESCSPEMSSGSYGDMTSPEDYHSVSPPYSYGSQGSLDVSGVQATRTKLIKEGLKLTIQARRIVHGLDTVRSEYRSPPKEELTREDEERRRKRRERNKVAATKCRNKKKERTGRLAIESESLEVNNSSLRHEIHALEKERKELMDLLRGHLPHCGITGIRSPCTELQHSHRHPQGWPAATSSVLS